MRKGNNELIRLQTLIEQDRLSGGDNFIDLLKNDLNKLLQDYFCVREDLSVLLEKQGDNLMLKIEAVITKVKNFSSIPK